MKLQEKESNNLKSLTTLQKDSETLKKLLIETNSKNKSKSNDNTSFFLHSLTFVHYKKNSENISKTDQNIKSKK